MESSDLKWSVSNSMIAVNANTVFNAIHYNQTNGLIAYAASNSVMILDPTCKKMHEGKELSMPKVLFALNAHTTRVNAVQWLSPHSLVSIGGDEKLIVVWSCDAIKAREPTSWKAQ